jgi:hypothetical protein
VTARGGQGPLTLAAMAQRMIHALRQQWRRGQLQDGGRVKGEGLGTGKSCGQARQSVNDALAV